MTPPDKHPSTDHHPEDRKAGSARSLALAETTIADTDERPITGERERQERPITGERDRPITGERERQSTGSSEPDPPAEPASSRSVPIQPGVVLKHYEIIRELGKGGMGVVFLARDTRLGRLVAIKFLLDVTGPAAPRFLAEARATAQCRHENIVVIYDVGEAFGFPYMVLEYIEGHTLRAAMVERARASADPRDTSPSTAPLAVELMIPVVRALACAHEVGIVHRDLKPENILLSDGGPIKVVDFGIAKQCSVALALTVTAARAPSLEREPLTQDGVMVGTMPYMSPEQWLGANVDERTDVWAAGVILFELVTGAHPLAPFSFPQLATIADLDTPMPRVRDRRPNAGPIADVIDRCLKKRHEERIGSARELLEALESIDHERRAPRLGEHESPFAGLAAFQEADAARFFGRDTDVAAVIGKLRNQQIVAIAGPSGAGKSSFVRAGVLPALKRAFRRAEAFVIRPGRRPLAALADVLAQLDDTSPGASDEADPAALALTLRAQAGYLGARLRARCRKRGSDHRIFLVADQIEELYTLGIDPEDRAAFFDCIEGVADDAASPLRVLVTIRGDFLERLADDRHFMTEVTRGLVFLPPMTRDGLRDALQKPLEAARYRFEDDELIREMLDGLAGTSCPLPLLQFTAAKLWEARDRERRLLTREGYRALGGVAGALSTHADAVLAGLSSADQRLARSILVRLVTPERTRAVVRMDELCASQGDGGAAREVVDHLASARLLSIEASGEREHKTVELAHESLIERWAKLRRWLDEEAQDAEFLAQLRSAAQQWEKSGEGEGLLWRDRAAREAAAWLERRGPKRGAEGTIGLGAREERYLRAVVDLLERTQRKRRRVTVTVIAALSVVAVVVSTLAIHAAQSADRARVEAANARLEAQRADQEAARAQDEARQAQNATRMAAAREIQQDPTTALAILREIAPPDLPRGWAELTRWALYAGVARVVLPHPDVVHSAAWSPDGKRIVTACQDNTARVWSADGTGEPLILRGHEGPLNMAAWSPDGRHIVTASQDKTARVWSADGTGQPVVLRGHDGAVMSAAWSPDGSRIVTAAWDRVARVFRADGAGEPLILRGHEGAVMSAAWSPDSSRIVTASGDKTARVWSADGKGQPLILRGHQHWVMSAAWSPDGSRIVTASEDKLVRVYRADGKGEPVILRGHEDGLSWAAWSPDGTRIVTGSWDKTARVWSADGTGQPLIFRGHENSVLTAAFSPDGRQIVTASQDKTARIFRLDDPREPLVFRGHENSVSSVSFSPDGKRLVTGSWDKTARIFRADGTGETVVLRGHEDGVFTAVWSADGNRIVTASQDKTARVWSADGKGEPVILRGHGATVASAAWSPDGRRIVTASEDRTARIWSADGAGEPVILRGHDDAVISAAWSPDGKRIVTTSKDKTARVWSADGAGEPLILRGHEAGLLAAAWSPDGERIVTTSKDKTARVWSADGRGEPLIFRGHEHWVTGAAWSPDGKRIVTASQDKTVQVWSADGAGEPVVLRGAAQYNDVAWSPDGQRIAVASDDKTVSLWSDREPLRSPLDQRLWTATTYCLPAARRVKILGVSDDAARADQGACQRRVDAARAAAP